MGSEGNKLIFQAFCFLGQNVWNMFDLFLGIGIAEIVGESNGYWRVFYVFLLVPEEEKIDTVHIYGFDLSTGTLQANIKIYKNTE